MENINKIIDSLSPGEQNVMYNALQKKLNRGPEYTISKNGTGYSIKLNDKYENTHSGNKEWAYEYKTLEIMYDSKKKPHKIVIYSDTYGMAAIDLDANTYK